MSGNFKQSEQEEAVFIPAGLERIDYRDTESRPLTEAEKKTEAFFSELNGEDAQQTGTITVYRESSGVTGAKEYVDQFPADKYTTEALQQYLRNEYGPGDYRIQGRITGQKGIRLNTLLTIAKSKADRETGMVPYDPKAAGNDMALIVHTINESQRRADERMMMMLEEMRAEKNKPGIMANLMKPETLTALAPIVAAVGPALIKKLFTSKDPVEQLVRMMEVKSMLDDGKDSDTQANSWPALIEKGLGSLAALAPAMMAQKQGGAPAAAQQDGAQAVPPMLQAFGPHLKQVAELAAQGVEPAALAPQVVQAIPDAHRAAFGQFIQRDDAISHLAQVEPAVFANPPWWVELQAELDELLNGGDTDGENTPPDTDHAGSSTHNFEGGHAE